MAYEPGGYSEKLGNRYEGRWVARQLLLLLNEQFRSITLESVGDDETGVDLWIGHNDGSREAQQCKGENGTKAHWTLADLKSRRVLDHLRYQLNRDPLNRFTFVSSSQAPQLRDLSRSARDSKGDPESFYFDQIRNGSYARQANFTDWCKYLELKESDINDRAVAFDLLRRSDFHPFSDDKQEREILRLIAQQAVIGDVDAVLALLADKYAIRILIPCLNRIVKQKLQEKRAWRKRMSSDKFVPYPQTRIPPILLATLRAAMVALSRTSPKAFSQLSNRIARYHRVQSNPFLSMHGQRQSLCTPTMLSTGY